ncbi:MAG: DUF5723 family protein [Methylococcaceae bacterium]|nr:DUF5723 family protein [Prolixibacteraceae bacterium]
MFLTLISLGLQAQSNLSFYPLDEQFNAFDYNPAFLTSPEKFTFSIFPMAGMNLITNNQAILREAANKSSLGEISESYYKDLFNRLLDKPTFHESVEATFLNFTYGAKKGYFNFRVRDRQFLDASVNGEVTNFIFKTEIRSAAIGKVQHFPVQAAHYREYSLGYSFSSPDKRLLAGMRGKLYFGKFAFSSYIDGSITPKGEDYGLRTRGMVYISFPHETLNSSNGDTYTVDLNNASIKDYLFNSGNIGAGVDLGIVYKINPALSFSMSVIDLGRMSWKNNLNSRNMDTLFLLNSPSYDVSIISGVPTLTKKENYAYSDTFDFFNLQTDSSSFHTTLPTTIYAGLKYMVNPGLSVSITDRYVAMKNLGYNSLSMAANLELNKKLTASIGYSIIGNSYFNVPLALLLKQSFGQMYIGTDNLLFLVSPAKADYASVSFGVCFYLFTHRNLLLKRLDYLPFYQPRKTIKNRRSGLLIKARNKEK